MTANVVNIHRDFDIPEYTDIRTCWEMVREGIEFILEQNPHLTYKPEDVYSECVAGKSMLFVSPLGFVVLSVQEDPFSEEKVLVVWIAYTHKRGKNNWLNHIRWFEGIAEYCGCSSIEAQSAVPELGKFLSNTGWTEEFRVYRRKVTLHGKQN
tara:strand:- start:729 stop:1187 length:459 start_codon:yes stop_codon:yes gene_type:complete